MNVAISGSRPPAGGFTLGEQECSEAEVADFPRGTRIGTGGSVGMDEIVMRAARQRGLYVVTFLPGARWRTDTSEEVQRNSHEIVDTGVDPLSRDHVLVEWATRLRALPLYEMERTPRSGTWATVRMAMKRGIVERVTVLRPRGGGEPVVLVPSADGNLAAIA